MFKTMWSAYKSALIDSCRNEPEVWIASLCVTSFFAAFFGEMLFTTSRRLKKQEAREARIEKRIKAPALGLEFIVK